MYVQIYVHCTFNKHLRRDSVLTFFFLTLTSIKRRIFNCTLVLIDIHTRRHRWFQIFSSNVKSITTLYTNLYTYCIFICAFEATFLKFLNAYVWICVNIIHQFHSSGIRSHLLDKSSKNIHQIRIIFGLLCTFTHSM